jgi:hypothetical protein
MRRSHVVALTVAVLGRALVTTPSSAQEAPAAARAFQAGSQAYAKGDFRVAAAAFDEAYRIAPRGAAAYDAGLAWEAAGEGARAADDYARALRSADLGTVERADTTGRLKALESRIGRLSVLAADDAEVSVDAVDVTDRAQGLHVMPGTHAIRVRHGDGRVDARTVHVSAGEAVEVRLDRREAPAAATPPEAGEPPAPAPSHEPRTRTAAATEPGSGPSTLRILSYVALGGAAVASGIAIATYESGLSAVTQFDKGGDQDASLRAQAENLRTATWISWGFAGALAATGVVLFFASPSSPTSPATAPAAIELLPFGARVTVGF